MDNENNKEVLPDGTSPSKDTTVEDKSTVEVEKDSPEDTDFEKELEQLEQEDGYTPAPKQKRSELEKAAYTLKHTAKRLKELGGDPAEVLGDEEEPAPKNKTEDTSQFVTKLDLAQGEAEKIAKTPGEAKLIMWYVRNRGMSVSDAHFLANKGKIQKTLSEIGRSRETIPAGSGGGAGQRQADRTDSPDLPEADRQRLIQSGMVYKPSENAYVGDKIRHRYDKETKAWVTERIVKT